MCRVFHFTRPSRDTQLILERIAKMDDKLSALKSEIESFIADAKVQVEASKAASQEQITAAVTKALADQRAGSNVDIDSLIAEVKAAHDKIAVPAFTPSGNA